MHPILGNGARLRLYLLSWLPFHAFLTVLPNAYGAMSIPESAAFGLPLLILYSFFCLSSWYLCQFQPLSRTSPVRLVGNHFAAACAMGAFWILLAIAWAWGLSQTAFPGLDARMERLYPAYFVACVLLYLLTVALHYLLASVESGQQAQTLARESQLKALKMQVNPHFLFNSLNSISALTMADGVRAREMCIKLSEFLRTTLQLGDRESISLQEEIALCMNYLEVERVRFGKRLQVAQSMEGLCGECQVPSLIVQPLVENAIKHGISGVVEGGTVTLDVRCGRGMVRIRVTNPYDPEYQPAKRSGIGLTNIRQRLQARYGDEARLEVIHEDPTIYTVEIRLPCASAASAGND